MQFADRGRNEGH